MTAKNDFSRQRLPARIAAGLFAAALIAPACSLNPIDLEGERPLALRSTITAADGSVLARLWRQNRVLASIDAMPRHLIRAVLAAEDSRFFSHEGYDLKAIARAAIVNFREGAVVQGGSTITQQYVKNTYFRHPARSLERKARELRLSLEVEATFSKKEILERYLNTVYFGEGAYGVKAAAQAYFGHGLKSLSLRESTVLASLMKSPSYYNPRSHPGHARERRDYVLDRMIEAGWLAPKRAAFLRTQGLGVTRKLPRTPARQPYFVEAVRREVLRMRALGGTLPERARSLYKGGLTVRTTLEPDLQRAAEDAVRNVLGRPGDPAAAMVVIRPSTGEIVAMVGGEDWSASQVNLALGTAGGGSGRQPGSSFKPIVLAAALEYGYRLDDKFESAPAVFPLADGSTWTVRNAEGGGFGPLNLDEATVHSVNGVYARLALEVGAERIASQAKLMGVRADVPAYPSIALGSADVSVLDMAAAYATLANGGTALEPTTIKSVELPSGEAIRPQRHREEFALSAGNAYQITRVLEGVITRGTGTAAAIGRPAAGKTGTTNDYTDAWFVGYTPDLVAAVWVGYPKGTIPMTSVHGIRVFGGTFPAIIWRTFMTRALSGVPPHDFRIPIGSLVSLEIDPKSGLLAAPWCPGVLRTMLRELAPTSFCPQPEPKPSPSASPEPKDEDKDKDKKEPPDKPKKDPTPAPSPSPSPKD